MALRKSIIITFYSIVIQFWFIDLIYVVLFMPHLIGFSFGNFEVTQCERRNFTISCDQGTYIMVEKIHFGPLSNSITPDQKYYQVAESNFNISIISSICNDRNYCFIDSMDQDYFNLYPALPRLVNISYYCEQEYEFIGCYQDNKVRLFTGRSKGETFEMSASICRSFCLTYPLFGTENGNECFCGYESEIEKLNQSLYERQPTAACNAKCARHPEEMCGKYSLLSVYKVNEEKIGPIKTAIVKARQISDLALCSTEMKNTRIESHQVTTYCANKNFKTCDPDNTVCWSTYENMHNMALDDTLTKYLRINYSCRDDKRNLKEKFGSDIKQTENGGLIGIIVGVVFAVCFTVIAVLTGLFIRKRISQNIDTAGLSSNRTLHEGQYDDLQSRNSVTNYADLARAADYEEIQEENKYTSLQTQNREHDYDDLSKRNT